MTFEVRLSARAERDLEDAYLWFRRNAPSVADRWYNGFLDALLKLERDPSSFPLVPEPLSRGGEVRHLLYGSKRNWRAIFVVRGAVVIVLHIRHAAREPLGPDAV